MLGLPPEEEKVMELGTRVYSEFYKYYGVIEREITKDVFLVRTDDGVLVEAPAGNLIEVRDDER